MNHAGIDPASVAPEGRCLVTGGAGFLGAHVVGKLLADGVKVRILDRLATGDVDHIAGEVSDIDTLDRALDGVSDVIHLACTSVPKTSEVDPVDDVVTNVVGTVALLERCAVHGVKRFVMASSGGTVYGIARAFPIPESHPTVPISVHGAMKLALETYAGVFQRTRGLQVVILRIGNAYGPGQNPTRPQGVVGVFLDRLLRNAPIRLEGNGEAVRDFVHGADIATAFALARRVQVSNTVFNIGTGRGVPVRDVLARLEKATGRTARIESAPPNPFDVPISVLDATLAREQLGWRPVRSLEEELAHLAAAVTQGADRT